MAITLPVLADETFDDEDSEAIWEAEGITVTGTRTPKRLLDTPVAVEIITAEEIENSTAATVTEVLESYGLVHTNNAMGDYVQMQGMGEGRILYLINGRRVSGRVAQRLRGETLPINNVERIEIIRGPQSALYGSDAIGGVINIITKQPPNKVSFSGALFNSFLPAYDNSFNNFNLFREQNLSAVIGFPLGKSRNSIDIEASRGSFHYNETASASLLPKYYRGALGLESSLSLTDSFELRFGGSAMVLGNNDQVDSWGSLERRDYLRVNGNIEGEWLFSDKAVMNFRLYDSYYQRDWDSYAAINDRWVTGERYENDNIIALELLGMWHVFPKIIFTGGIEGSVSTMQKYNLTEDFLIMNRQALFFQAEYFVSGRYSAITGLRLERNSHFGFTAAPKVSGMLHLGHNLRTFVGVGLGFRAPDFTDLYIDADMGGIAKIKGNPDLKPEYAIGSNLGLEWSRGVGFIQTNIYYQELFNEISYVYYAATDENVRMNISRSLRAGIDTEGRINLPFHIFASTGYSWLFAWDRSERSELHIQPAHTCRARVGFDLSAPKINTYLQARWFSKVASYPDTDHRFILDYYFTVRFGQHIRLNVGIDNITGELDPIGPITKQTFSVGVGYIL